MSQRYVTGAIIFLAVLASFLAREITVFLFDIFLLTLIILAVYEFSKLLTKMSFYNSMTVGIAYPVLAYALLIISIYLKFSVMLSIFLQIGLIFLVFIATFLYLLLSQKKSVNEIKTRNLKISIARFAFNKSCSTLLTIVYPTFPLLLLVVLNHLGSTKLAPEGVEKKVVGLIALVIAFLIPMITDTFAMITGSLIGGKKLAPKISPNKTISGAIGGLVFACLVMVSLFILFDASESVGKIFDAMSIKLWHILIVSIVGSVFCQIGDLFESYIKRKAEVKDSGSLFPGHGGVLDRFDSHIFNALVVFAFFMILL